MNVYLRTLAALGLLLVPSALALGGAATVLSVPGDSDTIQGAVDLAGPDTIIQVGKDTYVESVVIAGKTNLTLLGQGKPVIAPGAGLVAISIGAGCDGVVVQGFLLQNALVGVDISGSTNVSVIKCLIRDSGSGIVATESSVVLIEKNKLTGIAGNGLDIGALAGVTGSLVTKNTVDGTGGHGIALVGTDNRAEKNKVKGAGVVGLLCGGTGNVLDSNAVTESGDDGMGITALSTGNTLSNNTVRTTGDEGIRVEGDGNTVTGCKVSVVVDEGIELIGANNVLEECKVSKSGDDGVLCEGIDNTVRGCKVKSAGGDGFEARAIGNDFDGCKSSKSGADGFHVSGKGHTFTGNKATGSFDLDLEDENGVEGPNTYEGNTFPKNNIGPGV